MTEVPELLLALTNIDEQLNLFCHASTAQTQPQTPALAD